LLGDWVVGDEAMWCVDDCSMPDLGGQASIGGLSSLFGRECLYD